MNKRVATVFLLASVVGANPAQADVVHIDAAKWLDGCLRLVQQESEHADQMEQGCVSDAFDYCEFRMSRSGQTACVQDLTENLNIRTAVLLTEKPDTSRLTGFGLRGFERARAFAAKEDHSGECTAELVRLQLCDAMTALIRWTSARSAWRIWKRYEP